MGYVIFWIWIWIISVVTSTLSFDPTLFTYAYHGGVHAFGILDLLAYLVPFEAAIGFETRYPFVDKR